MSTKLRADAVRNRVALLAAADAVFAEKGPGASTAEVARRAGVAVGTVFRHFPTKPALIEAVFVERLRHLGAEARSLAAEPDAGSAFETFIRRWAGFAVAKQAFVDALSRDGVDVAAAAAGGDYPRVRAELDRAVGDLLARAQAAGAIRADIGLAEVDVLLVAVARGAEHAADPGVRARSLGVLMDGLRPRP